MKLWSEIPDDQRATWAALHESRGASDKGWRYRTLSAFMAPKCQAAVWWPTRKFYVPCKNKPLGETKFCPVHWRVIRRASEQVSV